MSGGNISGGDKSKKASSGAETRQLAAMGNRFEQEARPSRNAALNQLAGILNFGVDWLGPSMGGGSAHTGSQGPRKLTKYDLIQAYERNDPGKAQDLNRILGDLPDEFTIDELKGFNAQGKGLSGRSQIAWDKSIGELDSLYKSGGSGMGGMSSGGGSMFLPIAQTAIERSKQSTSQSMRGLENRFAGMKGMDLSNPFAQSILSQTKMLGDQQTSQIPSRIIEAYMSNVLPLAFGQSPAATSALSNAASINAQNNQANAALSAQQGQNNQQMISDAASAIAMIAMMT